MFDGGVPDHFHQFIASRSSIPLPLSFSHHGVAVVSSPPAPPPQVAAPPAPFAGCFESYPQAFFSPPPHHHHQSSLQQLQQPSANKVEEAKEEANSRLLSTNLVLERERSVSISVSDHSIRLWTNDEVLALLRIRSSLENWFPDFTWEHVSRKLAEVGFQRSAEQCKQKFEEESRHFSHNMSYNKSNYRFFSDLDELYQGENPEVSAEKSPNLADENEKEAEEEIDHNVEEDAGNEAVGKASQEKELEKETIKSRKRKRKNKFEMFKGFCEAIVKKIVAQQEELHNKLLEGIIRRDEESIEREEAWKNEEIDRITKEIESRRQEQAAASDRQAKIIEFLKKFTEEFAQDRNLLKKIQDLLKVTTSGSSSATASCEILPQSTNTTCQLLGEQISNPTFLQPQSLPTSSGETTPSPQKNSAAPAMNVPKASSSSMASQNPNDSITATTKVQDSIQLTSTPSSAPKFSLQMDEKGDRHIGKRWPSDEVLALINLRCSLNNNSSTDDNKDASKGPLWERISQMMLELGYKRSAKRCKEKWENINKYFRKTKDNKKKRSMDSRTCPYFHKLSSLYSQGTLVGHSDMTENC